MKRSTQALGVPLMLAVGFGLAVGQGDTRSPYALAPLPGTLAQAFAPKATTPKVLPPDQRQAIQKYLKSLRIHTLPQDQLRHGPGDNIPHTYLVFGLRTGPGGMAFTDQNGDVIPVPSNAQIFLKPFNTLPIAPPVTNPFPRTSPLPAPKK